jgi:hypothetical protein
MIPSPLLVTPFVLYAFWRFFLTTARWTLAFCAVDLDKTFCPDFLKAILTPESE